ncbi:tryptophan 2,3-dioxygenase [Jeotgalibacillus aurantiacus]|uniref:tryptophan 2,3-dioxygenase n=1 Tax=Jeotgalibacillus aurantiacus TaxID=2763266 RepID=UPI001D0B8B78|nr:tryptophan 2,3-dioxygenase [Jeotgalibacillus aurantiacus]
MKQENAYTDFKHSMTYSEYLSLDQVLGAQKRLSSHHDEMLFIVIHQVSELWMKLILHELRAACQSIGTNSFEAAFKQLARVSKIQNQIIQAWDVLATMTPSEYIEFRDTLGKASGFQSFQYRQIEFLLGHKTPHVLKIYEKDQELLEVLTQAHSTKSIYDLAIEKLAEAGFTIDPQVLSRDVRQSYESNESVKQAWMNVYKNKEAHWTLYQLAEKLVDIEDCLQQWRFRHMKTVERIIGFKTGTGGSSGVNYLKSVLEQSFFPELWELRTEL